MVPLRPIIFASFLVLAVSSRAQEDAAYEQVLLPFDTLIVNGANGERWSAELRVRNSADVPVNLFPETCFPFGHPFPCDLRIDVAAGATQILNIVRSDSLRNPGVLLYVPRSRRDHIDFGLTVRNLAAHEDVGTSIPVVRESRLLPRSRIIGVPIKPAHRHMLRVYEPFWPVNPVFRVQVIDEDSNTVITEREYSRNLGSYEGGPVLIPATFDFSDALVDAERGGVQRVTVTVERVWPRQLGFWPMISVTSNQDGRIAIFTPQ